MAEYQINPMTNMMVQNRNTVTAPQFNPTVSNPNIQPVANPSVLPGQTVYSGGQVCTCTPISTFQNQQTITPAQMAYEAYQQIKPQVRQLQGLGSLSGELTDAEVQKIVIDHFNTLGLTQQVKIGTAMLKADFGPLAGEVKKLMEVICTQGVKGKITSLVENNKKVIYGAGAVVLGTIMFFLYRSNNKKKS